MPDGLELYLALDDITEDGWLGRIRADWERLDLPAGFVTIVEGPLRGLDGAYFDATSFSQENQALLQRLVIAGVSLHADAVNIHAIAPTNEFPTDYETANRLARQAALPLIRYYASICVTHGLIPLVENIPPVARMRENSWVYSTLGMSADDLTWLCARVRGLGVTLDTSHAGLYVNAAVGAGDETDHELDPLVAALEQTPEAGELRRIPDATDRLLWYADALDGLVESVHVSNARGLTGEGLPYGEGDFDLDRVTQHLARKASWLVTETLEPDHDRATLMRDAQSRVIRVLAGMADG